MNSLCFKQKIKSIFILVLSAVCISAQLAAAPSWIGNVIGNSTPDNFSTYWNQVTSENAAKWGSVESSRDSMNWSSVDSHVNYANGRGYPYKFHCLVWGSQEPGWISGLSANEQLGEVQEWIQAVGSRYSPGFIDVVNEPLHAQPSYKNALGGAGSTGWDWVIRAFELANQYCSGKMLINEYGIVNDGNAVSQYITIINLLKSRGLIDGIGIQTHCFNVDNTAASTLRSNLNTLASTGLPIYVSELDITGSDSEQLSRYQEKFPIFYDSSNVSGITLWGYIQGQTWKDNTHLVSSGSIGASERPAMQWLKQYLNGGGPVPTTYPNPTPVPTSTGNNTIVVRARGTNGSEEIYLKVNNNTIATFALTTSMTNYTASTDLTGGITIEFYNDASGRDVQVDYIQVNGSTRQAENQSYNSAVYQNGGCGNGSYSEWMHCNGIIGFGDVSGSTPATPNPTLSPTPVPTNSDGALGCGICNWYGTNYPMCCTTTSGWGWENSTSCISVSTCNSQ